MILKSPAFWKEKIQKKKKSKNHHALGLWGESLYSMNILLPHIQEKFKIHTIEPTGRAARHFRTAYFNLFLEMFASLNLHSLLKYPEKELKL